MKTILVTGIEGFTGKYVARELRNRGYHVVGLAHVNAAPRSAHMRCDLTNKAALQHCLSLIKPDGIIHLAALSFIGDANHNAFYDVNLFGSLNILESVTALGLDVEKIILASSANVYGNLALEHIDERQVPAPVNHYAVSKLAMECMAKTWFSRLPIIVTRPFNYTGIGQRDNFLIPKIVQHFRQRKAVIELGNIDVARDFSDVRDIAISYVDLLASEGHSDIINLCSGKVHSLVDIIAMMTDIAGYAIDVKVNPDFVRDNEIKVLGGDSAKLLATTGRKPAIALKTTLFEMYHAD